MHNITLEVITLKAFIQYLEVMFEADLSFKQQVEYVSAKLSIGRIILSLLMPNVRGRKQSMGIVLLLIVTSMLTYQIFWNTAMSGILTYIR